MFGTGELCSRILTASMDRRDFLRVSIATPFAWPAVRVGSDLSPQAAWLSYVRAPTSVNAFVAASSLPRRSHHPVSKTFSRAVDLHLGLLKRRVADGDRAAALLAVRLHSAIHPGSSLGYLNYVIGTYIPVDPEAFLDLLHSHPHLIGNSKILLNLGLDLVDDSQAQHLEVQRRIAALESVSRPHLSEVRRETVAVLWDRAYPCAF